MKIFLKNLRLYRGSQVEGFALPTVLFAMMALVIAITFINKRTVDSLKANGGFRQRTEKEVIRMTIIQNLDCVETFRQTLSEKDFQDVDRIKKFCHSSSLHIDDGRRLKLSRTTTQGVKPLFGINGHPGDLTYTVGKYLVRAGCSADEQSFIIQGIPITGKDKMSGSPIDWNSKESVLVGAMVGIQLCSERKYPKMSCGEGSCWDADAEVYQVRGIAAKTKVGG